MDPMGESPARNQDAQATPDVPIANSAQITSAMVSGLQTAPVATPSELLDESPLDSPSVNRRMHEFEPDDMYPVNEDYTK